MKNILRGILIVCIIVNCVVIFNFSSEKSEKSNKTSSRVVERIIESNPKTKNLSKKEKEKKMEELVFPIRKMAHFTVYMVLGMLLYLYMKTYEWKDIKQILLSLILAFLYACSDEIHQRFVSGRSGEFRDVCIDSCGALFGILLVFMIYKVIYKVRKNKNKCDEKA